MRTTAQAPSRDKDSGNKLAGIEILRFISAFAVLLWHYRHFSFVDASPVGFVQSQQPFYAQLSFFYRFGELGVSVFWCISGFIFFWKYATVIRDRVVQGYEFFVLRFSRLYPLHFVTLLSVALLQGVLYFKHGIYFVYQYNDAQHLFLQLFMASNWGFEKGFSFNGPIWSISAEVLVYALFYFTVRYLGASWMLVGGIFIASLVTVFLKIEPVTLFLCPLYFYAGCGAALVLNKSREIERFGVVADVLAVLGVLAPIVLIFHEPNSSEISPLRLVLVVAPCLVYLVARFVHLTATAAKYAQIAGSLTYSSYLLHFPLQLIVVILCRSLGIPVPMYATWFFLSFLAITFALSFLSYRYFEMPVQQVLRRSLLRQNPSLASQRSS